MVMIEHVYKLSQTHRMDSHHIQQALNLQLAQANTFDTYYAGSDPTLISVLKSVAMGVLDEPQIFLWGMPATGKTHILQAMCHEATASHKRAMYLPLQDLAAQDPVCIEGLQDMQLICIDDVHTVAKNPQWEQALFNFINHHRASGTTLIIASTKAPTDDIFDLVDLNSRAVWGPVYKLSPVDDNKLDEALKFHASVRGLVLPQEVRKFLLTRYQRDVSTLVSIIEALDKASLEQQRKVTIPFLKKTLN